MAGFQAGGQQAPDLGKRTGGSVQRQEESSCSGEGRSFCSLVQPLPPFPWRSASQRLPCPPSELPGLATEWRAGMGVSCQSFLEMNNRLPRHRGVVSD